MIYDPTKTYADLSKPPIMIKKPNVAKALMFPNDPIDPATGMLYPSEQRLAEIRASSIGGSMRGRPVGAGLPEVASNQARRVPTGMADRKALATAQGGARRVPTGMADRKAMAGSQQDVGVKQDGGFLSKLYADPSSARGKALQAAAATALQLSGYQDRPVTTGQVLGAMMQSGSEAYGAAQKAQADEDYRKMALAAQVGKKSSFAEKLDLLGIDVTTEEGLRMAREMAMKPDTVFMGGDEQRKEAYKAALKTRDEMLKQVNADRELGSRLQQAIDLINSGVETGRITSAMIPLKQVARDLGLLSDEQVENLSNQEVIGSIAAYLTPRMRVVGSGASSDRDMDFFARATVNIANTPKANLMIATMQKQVMDYNKRRLSLFEKYVQENGGSDFGFSDHADEAQGLVYQRPSTDEEFSQMIDDGLIKQGDVFFNQGVNEFQILTKEMMDG